VGEGHERALMVVRAVNMVRNQMFELDSY
jgi:hypothetical protein